MKKFFSLLCMITCVFGLTACGSTEEPTEFEQYKMDLATSYATNYVIPSFEYFRAEEAANSFFEYTAEEVEAVIYDSLGFEVDGYGYRTGIESFNSGYETIGNLVGLGEATAEIDGDQIIVRVDVQGEKSEAEAEIIFSNDTFFVVKSAALNPQESLSDLMTKAALNTLIGMGTVFAVLILISFIISCFGIIPKIQAKMSKKDNKEETKATGIDNAVAQITSQEEKVETAVVSEVVTDDTELVAVIAAAIAASMGTTSTDGFVVRSIRRVRRR